MRRCNRCGELPVWTIGVTYSAISEVVNGSTAIVSSSSRFRPRIAWSASRRRPTITWWLIQMILIVMNDVAKAGSGASG